VKYLVRVYCASILVKCSGECYSEVLRDSVLVEYSVRVF
jgi:hypothetical protein